MSDHTTNENADLEARLRTALSETAAQIDPKAGIVPNEATVRPLRRQNRAWMPALAAAAVVLLIVGVVTLINRGDDGGAPATFDGPVEITLMLPPGVDMDHGSAPPRQTFWDQIMGPYTAHLFCGTYVDGECRSVIGSAMAWFDEDGIPSGRYGAYAVSVGLAVPEQEWLEFNDGMFAAAADLEPYRPEGAVEVDINGHEAYAAASDGGASITWAMGEEVSVTVGTDSGDIDDVIDFARSLEEHTVAVPVHTPVVIDTIDEVMILAGAWEGAELVVGEDAEDDVASDVACISAFPHLTSERAYDAGHCAAVGDLSAWDVPAEGYFPEPPGNPDDTILALPPPSPSGIVMGIAPLDTAAVEVDFTLADGSTTTEVVEVVGAEYGFTSGFFAADGGEGAAVRDVRVVADSTEPEPASMGDITLYLPPGASLDDDPIPFTDTLPTGSFPDLPEDSPLRDQSGYMSGWWDRAVGPYTVSAWCEGWAETGCESVAGGAIARFHDSTVEEPTGSYFYVTTAIEPTGTWHGPPWNAYPNLSVAAPASDQPGTNVDINGIPATFHALDERTSMLSPSLTWRADDGSVITVHTDVPGGEAALEHMLEFAQSLEPHTAPLPTRIPVVIADLTDRVVVAGAWEDELFLTEMSGDTPVCFTVQSINDGQLVDPLGACVPLGTKFLAPEVTSGILVGTVPIDPRSGAPVDSVTLEITFADGSERYTETFVVGPELIIGPEMGFDAGFFVIDQRDGLEIVEARILDD